MPKREVIEADCLEAMRGMVDCSIDAIVTDPPYGLSKEPDAAEVLRHWLAGDDYAHKGGGFMGKSWDSFVPGPAVWREALRVLKPGGHVVSFFGTRTYDLGVMAIRLAKFEIREQFAWLTGQGFPKSRNLTGEWEGWGTATKPAWESIVLARKPLVGTVAGNVLAHGTGALNIDGCRIESNTPVQSAAANRVAFTPGEESDDGYIPGTGREYREGGRWPANVLLDRDAADLLDQQTGTLHGAGAARDAIREAQPSGMWGMPGDGQRFGDSGGASRFFYCAKSSSAERSAGLPEGERSSHPTVKPVALMQWLVRLVTPPGGLVLDPFAGSGTTGVACQLEGFGFVGVEREPEYVRIARARIAHHVPAGYQQQLAA